MVSTSDDLISGFQFRYDILKISGYRYFQNYKYVNFIQAQEQDMNVQQDSLLYIDTKMCQ